MRMFNSRNPDEFLVQMSGIDGFTFFEDRDNPTAQELKFTGDTDGGIRRHAPVACAGSRRRTKSLKTGHCRF